MIGSLAPAGRMNVWAVVVHPVRVLVRPPDEQDLDFVFVGHQDLCRSDQKGILLIDDLDQHSRGEIDGVAGAESVLRDALGPIGPQVIIPFEVAEPT